MDPAGIIKTVAVFVAGVVISVGSALIYSIREQRQLDARTRMISQAQQPAQTKSPTVLNDSSESDDQASPSSNPGGTVPSGPGPVSNDNSKAPQMSSVQPPAVESVRVAPRGLDQAPKSKSTPANRTRAQSESVPTRTDPTPERNSETPSSQREPPTSAPESAPAAAAPVFAPEPQQRVVTLNPGTELAIRLKEDLSDKVNRTGDLFHGTLEAPLTANGVVVADRGATVLGRVVAAEKSHLIHGRAELVLTLTQVTAVDGRPVPVQTNGWVQTSGGAGLMSKAKRVASAAGRSVAGAVSGAAKAIGVNSAVDDQSETSPSRYGQVLLPANTQLTFRLATPVTISEKAR